MVTKDLGMVTAYAYAVSKGYAGTEAQFAELMASYATVAQEAGDAALAAAQSAQDAASARDTAQTTVAGAIAGIQAEGQTQIAEVEEKGEEVRESIPADYTALSDEVSSLSSALDLFESVSGESKQVTDIVDAEGIGISIAQNSVLNNANTKSIYFKANPNTLYIVKRGIITTRFLLATTAIVPDNNVPTTQIIRRDTAEELTIKTGNNDNYIIAMLYYVPEDTEDWDDVLSAVTVTEYVDCSKTVQEVSSYIESELNEKGFWHNGAINPETGVVASDDRRLFASKFDPLIFIGVESLSDITMAIHAWNRRGTYIGCLKTSGSFATGYSDIAWVASYDFYKNKNYVYGVVLRNSTNTTMTVSDGEDIKIYLSNAGAVKQDIQSKLIGNVSGGVNGTGAFILNDSVKSLILKCEPLTRYTFKKTSTSSRFIVGVFDSYPSANQQSEMYVRDDEATSIDIITTNNSKYIVCFVYASNLDTDSFATIFNGMTVSIYTCVDGISRLSDFIWEFTRNNITRFTANKVGIIGDSISTFDDFRYSVSNYNPYYPADGVTDVHETWWKKVIDMMGAELDANVSYGGSRATARDGYPDFYSRCDMFTDPDLIFVALGTNDSNWNVQLGEYDFVTDYTELSESTFRTAYIKGIKALKNNYPDAKICCVCLKMTSDYKTSIQHIAETLSCDFVDASDYVGVTTVHPGVYGMKQIVNKVLYPW